MGRGEKANGKMTRERKVRRERDRAKKRGRERGREGDMGGGKKGK